MDAGLPASLTTLPSLTTLQWRPPTVSPPAAALSQLVGRRRAPLRAGSFTVMFVPPPQTSPASASPCVSAVARRCWKRPPTW